METQPGPFRRGREHKHNLETRTASKAKMPTYIARFYVQTMVFNIRNSHIGKHRVLQTKMLFKSVRMYQMFNHFKTVLIKLDQHVSNQQCINMAPNRAVPP